MSYQQFHNLSKIRKATSSLTGILTGVALDGTINPKESEYLRQWLDDHSDIITRPQFAAVAARIYDALSDGHIDEEERSDILWLCEKYLADNLGYDDVSDGLRELHAILGGITADGVINERELKGLQHWLNQHDYLKGAYPYDEVETLISQVLQDGVIDATEHQMLMDFFSEFVALADDRTITHGKLKSSEGLKLGNLVQMNPDIEVPGSTICFTGRSSRASRSEIKRLVTDLGGIFKPSLTKDTHFLIIGAEGNDCWQYACYGRKVEQAVKYRKSGAQIQLIHEIDFWDVV